MVIRRPVLHNPDLPLTMAVIILLIVGFLMVYSSSIPIGAEIGDPTYYFVRQVVFAALGLGLMVAISRQDYHVWQRLAFPAIVGSITLLALVLVVGEEVNGSRRWLVGRQVQPAELAKLALIVFMADWLPRKGDDVRNLSLGLIPFAIVVGIVVGLVIREPDFGAAAILFLIAVGVFFVAGADSLQLAVGGVVSTVTFVLIALNSPHGPQRLDGFVRSLMDPFSTVGGAPVQIQRALMALGSGGITGLGLGASRQKQFRLPLAHSDSIFAVIGEELGFLGSLAVILLFAFIIVRGIYIAVQAPDRFGQLLAIGVTIWIAVQVTINISGLLVLIPFTGVTLPLISYGGSSLVMTLAGIGLLLSVSRQTSLVGRTTHATPDVWRGNSGARVSVHRSR